MTSTILTQAAAIARQIEPMRDMDKHLARITVLDQLAAGDDQEFSCRVADLIQDIEAWMLEEVNEALESDLSDRELHRMQDSEGFRYAMELREKKIAKDAERAQKHLEWQSYLLKTQAA